MMPRTCTIYAISCVYSTCHLQFLERYTPQVKTCVASTICHYGPWELSRIDDFYSVGKNYAFFSVALGIQLHSYPKWKSVLSQAAVFVTRRFPRRLVLMPWIFYLAHVSTRSGSINPLLNQRVEMFHIQ